MLLRKETALRLDRLSFYVCFLFLNTTSDLFADQYIRANHGQGRRGRRGEEAGWKLLMASAKIPSWNWIRQSFLRWKERKDLQLRQNCSCTKKKVCPPAVSKPALAGFARHLSPLYMEVEKKKKKARVVQKTWGSPDPLDSIFSLSRNATPRDNWTVQSSRVCQGSVRH